jgi:hypothetical protein
MLEHFQCLNEFELKCGLDEQGKIGFLVLLINMCDDVAILKIKMNNFAYCFKNIEFYI